MGLVAVVAGFGCFHLTSLAATPYQAPSTRRMAERLAAIARDTNPLKNPFLNRRAAELFDRQLRELMSGPGATNGPAVTSLRYRRALELLNAGETQEALREFDTLRRHVADTGQILSPAQEAMIREQVLIAWLRVGEQENCQARRTSVSCLFPIRPAGVYLEQSGSRRAIPLLEAELSRGRSPKWAWLLNLAYMTLGEWPEKVPPGLLLSPRLFASAYDIRPFPDVAHRIGLDLNDLAGSVVAEDFDNDGDPDLMISAWGPQDPLRYFENRGDGTFRERTADAGITGLVGGLNLIQADYDNDGRTDVLVLRGAWFMTEGHHPNSLLRNNGDGTFDDVTEAAGVLSFHPTQTATWFDYDGDGWLDLFIGNETTGTDTNRCELFHSNRDGTFTELAAATGVDVVGLVKSVHSGDYDRDGRPDLYVSCQDRRNHLFHNEGRQGGGGWKFTDVAEQAGVSKPEGSFPAWFFDYDQDGWLDLYVSSYALLDPGAVAADYLGLRHGQETQRLYRNRRDGTFEDVSKAVGVARLTFPMAGNFGDLDNDGWPDFYLGTGTPSLAMLIPNRMFRNDGGRGFQEVTTSGGFGHLQKGHGIAFADLDLDGDQDIYACMGGAYEGDFYRNVLFENPGHGNRWLKLQLVGVRANRGGIGARIRVEIEEAGGVRSVWKDVNSGATFGGSPLRQELGLGAATAVRSVEIDWPGSGVRQTVTGLVADRCYVIREGQAKAEERPLKAFRLGVAGP